MATTSKQVVFLGLVSILAAACGETRSVAAPSPLETIEEILELHGLKGKSIDERSDTARQRPIEPAVLEKYFLDYRLHDPFLANLYIGFVTGVLASQQRSLYVKVTGRQAVVTAGRLAIDLRYRNDRWQVYLARSVPAEIKARAETARTKPARTGAPATP